jgi:hypothetical protein
VLWRRVFRSDAKLLGLAWTCVSVPSVITLKHRRRRMVRETLEFRRVGCWKAPLVTNPLQIGEVRGNRGNFQSRLLQGVRGSLPPSSTKHPVPSLRRVVCPCSPQCCATTQLAVRVLRKQFLRAATCRYVPSAFHVSPEFYSALKNFILRSLPVPQTADALPRHHHVAATSLRRPPSASV